MPLEIRLSQLQDRAQFEQAVAEHIERLVAFSREVGKPRPVAHPLVEAAVKRVSHPKSAKLPDDFMVDYIIVDDTPPPPAPLNIDDRKHLLVAQLRAAEQAAKDAVMPQRKLRLLTLKMQAANAKLKYDPATGIDDSDLSDDEKACIEQYKDAHAKYSAIELASAQAESDIEDLTDDTVDSWQVPQFT